jgi:SAM-dependent methyltransferase
LQISLKSLNEANEMGSNTRGILPPWLAARLSSFKRRLYGIPPVGDVNFGDLRCLSPVSRNFGLDRGQPIDRYYIEEFLQRHSGDIQGRVLEIQNNAYTSRYGKDRVITSDVFDVSTDNPRATIIGDIADAPHVPDEQFDAIIFTQTLLLIFDVRAAVKTLYRILKPGGVLLITVPGTVQVPTHSDDAATWCWSFTEYSLRRLLIGAFDSSNVETSTHGNVLAAIAMLEGLCTDELELSELNFTDKDYPVTITGRVIKNNRAT